MPGPDTGVAFSYQQYAAAEYLRRLLEGAFRRTGTNIKEVSVDSDYSGCADVIVLYESGQIHADYIQVKSRLRSSGPDWEKLWCKFIQLQLDAEQNKNVFRYVLAAPPFHSVSALKSLSNRVRGHQRNLDLTKSGKTIVDKVVAIANRHYPGVSRDDILRMLKMFEVEELPPTQEQMRERLRDRLLFVSEENRESWISCLVDLCRSNSSYTLDKLVENTRKYGLPVPRGTGLLGPRVPEYESGRFTVLDGVTWNQFRDLLLNIHSPRPEIAENPHVYVRSFEIVASSVLFSSAIGYNTALLGLGQEHPIKQLKMLGLRKRLVEVVPEQEFDLDAFAKQPHIREAVKDDLVRLSVVPPLADYYRALILQDAKNWLGDDETLRDPDLPDTEYKLRRSLCRDEELCQYVPRTFLDAWESDLRKRYENVTIQRSRSAFVRRLITAHIIIGYHYRDNLIPADPNLPKGWIISKDILQTITRAPADVLTAASGSITNLSSTLMHYLLPLCLLAVLGRMRRGQSALEALVAMRAEEDWVRETQRFLGEIDGLVREGKQEEAKALASSPDKLTGWDHDLGEQFRRYVGRIYQHSGQTIAKDMVLEVSRRLVNEKTEQQFMSFFGFGS